MKYQRLPAIVAAPDGAPLAVAEDLLRSADVYHASMAHIADLYAVRAALLRSATSLSLMILC